MKEITPDLCHNLLYDAVKQKLAFNKDEDFNEWRNKVRDKFIELTGIDKIKENACPPDMEIEEDVIIDGYRRIKFSFESEKGSVVPCYLCIPDTKKGKYPLVITLQGHSTGYHNSVGIVKFEEDESYQPRGAFGLQAVKRGYASLSIEQRGLGIRRPEKPHQTIASMCEYEAHIALLLGRTIIGERVWDVSKAIDVMSNFHCVDLSNIVITGNSGGGTASFYSACFDERIKICVPSCAFCTYRDSIMNYYHCSCNFIPHVYEWFEMADLSCLIAPRKLLIVAGKEDVIFPINGVRKAFAEAKEIFEKSGFSENVKLYETPKDHYWCEDIVWNAIADNFNK